MKLTREEAMIINWHMGGFDEAVRGGSFAISHAWDKYPLAVKLHISDLEASYLSTVMAFNLLGDALRDALDPKMRS